MLGGGIPPQYTSPGSILGKCVGRALCQYTSYPFIRIFGGASLIGVRIFGEASFVGESAGLILSVLFFSLAPSWQVLAARCSGIRLRLGHLQASFCQCCFSLAPSWQVLAARCSGIRLRLGNLQASFCQCSGVQRISLGWRSCLGRPGVKHNGK